MVVMTAASMVRRMVAEMDKLTVESMAVSMAHPKVVRMAV